METEGGLGNSATWKVDAPCTLELNRCMQIISIDSTNFRSNPDFEANINALTEIMLPIFNPEFHKLY